VAAIAALTLGWIMFTRLEEEMAVEL